MRKSTTFPMVQLFGVFLIVMGLSFSALAQTALPSDQKGNKQDLRIIFDDLKGPPQNIILDHLNKLKGKLDSLQEDVESLSTHIRGVTPNWNKKLDSTNGDANGCNSDRFNCLFEDTLVLDNETGLVWVREPNNSAIWSAAIADCANLEISNRKGFQLPLREQLASLIDTSNVGPALPTNHPFLDLEGGVFWTATTAVFDPSLAWSVSLGSGSLDVEGKINGNHVLCVRGGQSYDGQDIDALP